MVDPPPTMAGAVLEGIPPGGSTGAVEGGASSTERRAEAVTPPGAPRRGPTSPRTPGEARAGVRGEVGGRGEVRG